MAVKSILKRLKPDFWDHHEVTGPSEKRVFSFRRKWKLIVFLTSVIAMTPLVIKTVIDYHLTRKVMETEVFMNLSEVVSTTRMTVSFYLTQRRIALDFIGQNKAFADLSQPAQLARQLSNLQKNNPDFKTLALVALDGQLVAAAGEGISAARVQRSWQWLSADPQRSAYISALETNVRGAYRLVIMVRQEVPTGPGFFLLADLAVEPLFGILANLEMDPSDDVFLARADGRLQTPSRFHGGALARLPFKVPAFAVETRVQESRTAGKETLILGYAYIPETQFVLIVVKPKAELKSMWLKPRIKLIGFLIVSLLALLMIILGTATYLVNRIHAAENMRMAALHQAEHVNKLVSIGRLASGVAHEVNNPLAIIDQKAGLIKDLIELKGPAAVDEILMGHLDTILSSVWRCSRITRRMLDFARHMDTHAQCVRMTDIVNELLSFLKKEAERRSLELVVDIPADLPAFETDRGKLLQVLMNLFNNAFAAMEDNGRLTVGARLTESGDRIMVTVADTGHGIAKDDLKHIFEPFYSTRKGQDSSGLGLSIVYGLVQEMHGEISVTSDIGKGTRFLITLPFKMGPEDEGPLDVCQGDGS